MTRKDHILIASALRRALVTEIELHGATSGTAGGVRLAASAVADFIAYDSFNFDREQFLEMVRGEKALVRK